MTTTIEDIQLVGFVPLQFWGAEPGKGMAGKQGHWTSKSLLVHESVLEWCKHQPEYQVEHPTIRFSTGQPEKVQGVVTKANPMKFGGPSGWEAKWGAVYFDINTPFRLLQFCKQFKYPISIETEMALLNLYPDEQSNAH